MAGVLILSGALAQCDQPVETDLSQTKLQTLGQFLLRDILPVDGL